VVNQAKKITYEKQIIDSTNVTRTTWNIIKSEVCKKSSKNNKDNLNEICIRGKNTSNLDTIVEGFNSYFIRIADNIHWKNKVKATLSNNLLLRNYPGNFMTYMSMAFTSPFPKIQISKTTNIEIEKIIESLKVKDTHGYEGISIKILRACKSFISVPLSYLCNRALFEGVFPDRLKYAEIIPVHKRGDKKDLSNYRPISILTSFSKIFEKVMYKRLSRHLSKHNILSKHQFGFRANMGTDNACFKLISEVLNALNRKKLVSGIFCDLEKAFDCVSHEVLLEKLLFYGISDKQHKLYKSYLQDRYQRTVIRNGPGKDTVRSGWVKVSKGVPQGSVLGPLLFIVYINDLPKILESNSVPILFADDTSVLVAHTNPLLFKNVLMEVYGTLNDWFIKNLLSLNAVKTHCLNFAANKNVSAERDIGNLSALITTSNDIKFLGLTITSSLNWENHVNGVLTKLSTACYMLRNVKPLLSLKVLLIIYNSYFHSILSYGLMFWGNSSHAEKVFKLQKRVIRIMTGCNSRESCRNRFRDLNILPLRSQYIFALMMFVTKNADTFTTNKEFHDRSTRHNRDLYMNQVNLARYGKGVLHMATKVFNKLPYDLKKISGDQKKFKVHLKNFLLTNSFYTVDEFFNI
jgi:hypothetical protein